MLLTILIESCVRQVAPKILTYPSAHYLQLCSNSFKVKEPSAFWKNAEAVQLSIPWMWCNYIPESIVIPMMMTVTNYSSIVTGNPFLSFNDFFPWLESSSYFREGHRRSWLMNFKWMNFIFTRPKMAIGNSEAPLFASNLFSFYYPCQPPTTNWNWKSSWREYNESGIDFQGRCFLYEVFLPSGASLETLHDTQRYGTEFATILGIHK